MLDVVIDRHLEHKLQHGVPEAEADGIEHKSEHLTEGQAELTAAEEIDDSGDRAEGLDIVGDAPHAAVGRVGGDDLDSVVEAVLFSVTGVGL